MSQQTSHPFGKIGLFVSGGYSVAKGMLVLAILLCGFFSACTVTVGVMAGMGGEASVASGSSPASWTRVHDATKFKTTSMLTSGTAAADGKPMAVIVFNGDVGATGYDRIARHVDELIVNKDKVAGVLIIVTSPGGGVAQYGLVYAQLKRLRDAKIDLTVSIDLVGASGGYLMSLPANKIVAAPYALVGSIGVVTEFLNFNKFLVEHGVEPVTITAGEYKRTVTELGPVTPEGTRHLKNQLEAIHRNFMDSVTQWRNIDCNKVCTGDHWTAQESVEQGLNLVDEIGTSAEYLLKVRQSRDLLYLAEAPPPQQRGLFGLLSSLIDYSMDSAIKRLSSPSIIEPR